MFITARVDDSSITELNDKNNELIWGGWELIYQHLELPSEPSSPVNYRFLSGWMCPVLKQEDTEKKSRHGGLVNLHKSSSGIPPDCFTAPARWLHCQETNHS